MLRDLFYKDLQDAVDSLGGDSNILFISRSANYKRGDFVALFPPEQGGEVFAKRIAAELLKKKNIQSVSVERFFVNVKYDELFWHSELSEILSQKEKYGRLNLGNGENVNVEFISANPTGPLTVGNARGGFLGDAISAVLEKTGHSVTKEYYFNDSGTQIEKLISSVKDHSHGTVSEETQYKGEYIQELAEKYRDQLQDRDIGEKLTKEIFEKFIKQAISSMGIEFDEWSNERRLLEDGEVEKAFERLAGAGLTYEKDGALWVKTGELGDQRDRVLRKSTGDITYLGTDIAYHIVMLEKRGFDRAIKIWGADHAAQAPSLEKIIARLLPTKKIEFVIMQFVRLIKEGEEFKISKRAGTYVTVEELIDEIGVDAARWYILSRSPNTHINLDMDQAREQSQKNPVYYVQYSYARAHQIKEKVKTEKAEIVDDDISKLTKEEELSLIKKLSEYPEVLENIALSFGKTTTYEINKLAQYSHELATTFHNFYETCLILEEGRVHGSRLSLVEAFQTVLKDSLSLLGVSAPERM